MLYQFRVSGIALGASFVIALPAPVTDGGRRGVAKDRLADAARALLGTDEPLGVDAASLPHVEAP